MNGAHVDDVLASRRCELVDPAGVDVGPAVVEVAIWVKRHANIGVEMGRVIVWCGPISALAVNQPGTRPHEPLPGHIPERAD